MHIITWMDKKKTRALETKRSTQTLEIPLICLVGMIKTFFTGGVPKKNNWDLGGRTPALSLKGEAGLTMINVLRTSKCDAPSRCISINYC